MLFTVCQVTKFAEFSCFGLFLGMGSKLLTIFSNCTYVLTCGKFCDNPSMDLRHCAVQKKHRLMACRCVALLYTAVPNSTIPVRKIKWTLLDEWTKFYLHTYFHTVSVDLKGSYQSGVKPKPRRLSWLWPLLHHWLVTLLKYCFCLFSLLQFRSSAFCCCEPVDLEFAAFVTFCDLCDPGVELSSNHLCFLDGYLWVTFFFSEY